MIIKVNAFLDLDHQKLQVIYFQTISLLKYLFEKSVLVKFFDFLGNQSHYFYVVNTKLKNTKKVLVKTSSKLFKTSVSDRFRYSSDFECLTNCDRKLSLPSQFEMSIDFRSSLCSVSKFKLIGKTSQFGILRCWTFNLTIVSMNPAGITFNQAFTSFHREVSWEIVFNL